MRFAITDIETTGSHAGANSITEIAIIVVENAKEVDRYETLINPERAIPYFITRLTGINDDMVKNAPRFEDVAKKIDEVTSGCVFVAHNVNFDYSFIKAAMNESGFDWHRKRMCTVKLSRKAFPGHRSYSLSNICRDLQIKNNNPHRAMGDTQATTELFLKIYTNRGELVEEALKPGGGNAFLPNHLDEKVFIDLPDKHGVYYFHNSQGKIIYIGKANNIKKRIRGHFHAKMNSERRQAFIKEIHNISYQLTGSELLAYIIEDLEIKKYWPIYNRAQKRKVLRYGVITYEDQLGFKRLGIHRLRPGMKCVRRFYSPHEARQWLFKFALSGKINTSYCGLPQSDKSVLVNRKEHNQCIDNGILKLEELNSEILLRLPGRTDKEYTIIHCENTMLRAIGYIDNDVEFSLSSDLFQFLEEFPDSQEISNAITRQLDNIESENLIFLQKKMPD